VIGVIPVISHGDELTCCLCVLPLSPSLAPCRAARAVAGQYLPWLALYARFSPSWLRRSRSQTEPNLCSWGERQKYYMIQKYYIQLRPDVRPNSIFFPAKCRVPELREPVHRAYAGFPRPSGGLRPSAPKQVGQHSRGIHCGPVVGVIPAKIRESTSLT
jgi:hypothetical protein